MPSRVEIYPREGTETVFRFRAELLPAVEIYPREGMETRQKGYRACRQQVKI